MKIDADRRPSFCYVTASSDAMTPSLSPNSQNVLHTWSRRNSNLENGTITSNTTTALFSHLHSNLPYLDINTWLENRGPIYYYIFYSQKSRGIWPRECTRVRWHAGSDFQNTYSRLRVISKVWRDALDAFAFEKKPRNPNKAPKNYELRITKCPNAVQDVSNAIYR